MGLDADCAAVVAQFAEAPPFHAMPIEQARMMIGAYRNFMGPPEAVGSVEDRALDGVSVRIFRPEIDRPVPVVVYLHGGGWSMGDLDLTDPICRMIVNRSGCAVVSVDYRLAPEHPFPAALDDAFAVTRWLGEHGGELGIDPERIAVMGDSAGGNLAAGVTLRARDQGAPRIAFQVLVYPATAGDEPDTASHAEFGAGGYVMTTSDTAYFWRLYTGGSVPASSYARPLRMGDLSGLPPALILTCECDPLRDEGESYARALEAAGNQVELHRYDGTMHGFFYMPAFVAKARDALEQVSGALAAALASAVAAG